MVISPAYAQAAIGGGGFDLLSLAPLVLIFVVFYFLLIRPQQKKAKDHREMIGSVRRGDNVVTGGGIIGRVTKVMDDERVQVQIADGVRVEIARPTLANVLARGAPAIEKKGKGRDDGKGADQENEAPGEGKSER
jgi:preprotein translocase subunit YajC